MRGNTDNLLTIPTGWRDYELIDCGDSEKLERCGNRILIRPEPAAYWAKVLPEDEWKKKHDIRFISHSSTKGEWVKKNASLPDEWMVNFQSKSNKITFRLALTKYKHIGIFPEQAANWEYISSS